MVDKIEARAKPSAPGSSQAGKLKNESISDQFALIQQWWEQLGTQGGKGKK